MVDIATTDNGFTYALIHCRAGAAGDEDDGYVIFRFTSTGSMVWGIPVIPAASGTNSYIPSSVDVDPANRAWVWYDVDGALTYLDVWGTDGVKDWDDIESFTSAIGITRTTFEELNATSFNAYAGGPGARVGFTCTDVLDCPTTFELVGNPGIENVHYAGPYWDALYGEDTNNGGGASEVYIVNRDTGAILTSATHITGGPAKVWFNPPTDQVGLPYGVSSGTVNPRFAEYNKTTLANTRDIEPIEANVYTYDQNAVQDAFIDGAGSVFYCGLAQTPAVKIDSFLSKFNSTVNMGMRWNITIDKVITTNFERAISCALGHDGSVFVGLRVCDASDATCEAYVRKYAGAGIAREPQNVFEGFSIPTTTTPFASGSGAIGFKDFCLAVGFEDTAGRFLCGLVIVLTSAGIMAFVLADKKDSGAPRFGKGSIFGGGITAAGMSIFVTGIELWPLYTLVIMIAAVAFLIGYLVKRQFAGG